MVRSPSVGESRDIALDLVACACGLLFSVGADPPRRARLALLPGSRRVAAIFIPIVACTFTAFFQTVQTAVRIDDGERGVSCPCPRRSSWMRRRATASRAGATGLPRVRCALRVKTSTSPRRCGISPGRESAFAANDAVTAAGENAVLERYFAPFLDARFPTALRVACLRPFAKTS